MTSQIPDDLETLAQLCKATGDALRLEILRVLKTDSLVCPNCATYSALSSPP